MTFIKRLWNDEEAANAVEYGLVTAVIAVALIGALFFFRQSIRNMFNNATNNVNNAPTE
jgi:pilus assembly protein Flp/PilA